MNERSAEAIIAVISPEYKVMCDIIILHKNQTNDHTVGKKKRVPEMNPAIADSEKPTDVISLHRKPSSSSRIN